MKTSWFKFAGVLSLAFAAASVTGCGAGDVEDFDGNQDTAAAADDDGGYAADESLDESADLGTAEQGLMSCSNPDGANSAMAAIAVAAAQELKRWQPARDFVMFNTSGQCESCGGPQQAIKLTSGSDASGPRGKSRCADGKCARLQALLDMQYEQANDKIFFQGSGSTKTLLNPGALRSRLVAKLNDQTICDSNARDGDNTACPKEEHVLTFQSSSKGSCDTNFFFNATKPNGQPLSYPNQLKNKLKFADITNPYINFQNLGGGVVSVDPTFGLNEEDTTSTGNCMAACTRISLRNVEGECCSCGGVNKGFVKLGWSAVTYSCR
jgi:hypothetical protein